MTVSKRRGVLCLLFTVIILTPASAFTFASFTCTVQNVYALKKDGSVQSDVSLVRKGHTFVVERKTAKMLGDLSSTDWIGRNEVLDLGSEQQSYKALYVSPPLVHVRLLLIEEWREGEEKPFLFVQDTEIYAGLCRYSN